MPAASNAIPLFPAPTVLFPGSFMTLQVTNEPQRAMLQSCVEGARQLGIVLAGSTTTHHRRAAVPCTTGCLASIALLLDDNTETLPTGAILYGEHRIRIREITREGDTISGSIELLDEVHGVHAVRKVRQASELFQRYLALLRQRYDAEIIDVQMPENPTQASYMLASILYLPSEIKQRWLESASATTRLDEQIAFLQEECDKLALFLALAQHTPYRFTTPDYELYTALVSAN